MKVELVRGITSWEQLVANLVKVALPGCRSDLEGAKQNAELLLSLCAHLWRDPVVRADPEAREAVKACRADALKLRELATRALSDMDRKEYSLASVYRDFAAGAEEVCNLARPDLTARLRVHLQGGHTPEEAVSDG